MKLLKKNNQNVYCILIPILLLLFLFTGCKKQDVKPKVDENGLTDAIKNIVPQSIINEMKRLGMPINGGSTPPLVTQGQSLEATYFGNPFILVSSNRPSDITGNQFADYRITFRQQDNQNLTIQADYYNGPESGIGIGSFIVGEGCKFSVFISTTSVNSSNGSTAKYVYVISGSLLPDGIENMYLANFMVDNNGNVGSVWIDNGQGRVIYDSDGFSELIGTNHTWYSALPACPCTYTEAKKLNETSCPAGKWYDCGTASNSYHYGAAYEVRWNPLISGQPGQQCTYDQNKLLITGGIAAGSPDFVSPSTTRYCSYSPDWLTQSLVNNFCNGDPHCESDVKPWLSGNDKSIPCWQYLRDWPADSRLACTPNIVSGIDHMSIMIGNMTCEEASLLIRSAKESSASIIDSDLRNYIIGVPAALNNVQLKTRLQAWKSALACPGTVTEGICLVISKAIANL